MVTKRKLRRLSAYFTNEVAQTFVLEPADTVTDQGQGIIRLDRLRDGLEQVTWVNLAHAAYATLQAFWVEEHDGPAVVREKQPEAGELL